MLNGPMKKLIIAFFFVCSFALNVQTRSVQAVDPLDAIENDYRRGLISLDEKVLLQVKAIRNYDQLPVKYKSDDNATFHSGSRSATLVLLYIRTIWETLSPETRSSVNKSLTRIGAAFTYDSPGGFFKLHYDTAGPNAVEATDTSGNSVPDFIDRCAAYLDTSYVQHTVLGYWDPPSDGVAGGDSLYDIYFLETGIYGYMVPEGQGPAPWNDYYSYIVLNRDFLDFPPNNDPEGDVAGAAKATVAHEFHHAVQVAYDASEDLWFMESDATYMEDIVFDNADDNYNYLQAFYSAPHLSLTENTVHAYSSFVWEVFLAEKFDTSLMVAIWEGATVSDVLTVQRDTLLARYGWELDSAFAEFTLWNFATGSRNDGQHFTEADQYPPVYVDLNYFGYPVNIVTSSQDPAGYGASYVRFYPGGAVGTLKVTFNGNQSPKWAAYIVKSVTENEHEFEKISLDTNSYFGLIEIPNFENYYSVTLIGINLSESSPSTSFTYSADVNIPYSLTSALITVDSSVYSGGERLFELRITNTSPVVDMLSVTAWDDRGWIQPDTINRSLGSGMDTLVKISVNPPQGTELDLVSNLTFRVWSWGDTSVADTQLTGAVTRLYRGDTNFSGAIDIADLTYFVAFLFTGGSNPEPLLTAADFGCDGKVEISDLTALVRFLFQAGPAPICNPY